MGYLPYHFINWCGISSINRRNSKAGNAAPIGRKKMLPFAKVIYLKMFTENGAKGVLQLEEHIYIYVYYMSSLINYLEPVCPLFLAMAPPKQGLFQSKQGSFGFQVYIYI